MVLLRYLLPIATAAVTALAQCDGTINIENQDDADSLSSCSKIDGDVIIDSSASGTLTINGVEEITGDLECINATELSSLSADSITSIGGRMNLEELQILTTLQFDVLTEVTTIRWLALPALQSLAFNEGVSNVENILISNTGLTSLQGLDLDTVELMDVNNNRYLEDVDVKNMRNITKAISFEGNAKELEIKFPNLEFAANMTFKNISDVSMPSLEYVNGSIGFYSNTFESVYLPNLTETGKALVFQDHEALTNITAPQLTEVGAALNINDNPELAEIDGFPELQVIGGALDLSGNFDEVSLPALEDVRGGFNMQTRSEDFSCGPFDELREEDIVKGTYTCEAGSEDPSGLDSDEDNDEDENAGSRSLTLTAPFYLSGLIPLLLVL